MPDITVEGLVKEFSGGHRAVDGVDLRVAEGELVTLLGPSGCGKSTTLACIAGLEDADRGCIWIGGRQVSNGSHMSVPSEERNIGMVFQSYALWPHMTVEGNLLTPLKMRRTPHDRRRKMVCEALEVVGLSGLGERYPHELSGGQQQRVALARALAYSPEALLLDEPLSNLDARLREEARLWLKEIQVKSGSTALYVTHDQSEALAISDRVVVMSEGRIRQSGTPQDLYISPSDAEVARIVGRSNSIRGTVVRTTEGWLSVSVAGSSNEIYAVNVDSVGVGSEVDVVFRPEDVTLNVDAECVDKSVNTVEGVVTAKSYVGFRYEYTVEWASHRLLVYGGTTCLNQQYLWLGIPAESVRAYKCCNASAEVDGQSVAVGGTVS